MYLSWIVLNTVHLLPCFASHKTEINTLSKEPVIYLYTNVLIIEYPRINNNKTINNRELTLPYVNHDINCTSPGTLCHLTRPMPDFATLSCLCLRKINA